MVSARTAYLKHDYPTLENQPESLINEVISLTSMDDSSVKLTRVGWPNNLYMHLARDGHWQRKWISLLSAQNGQFEGGKWHSLED